MYQNLSQQGRLLSVKKDGHGGKVALEGRVHIFIVGACAVLFFESSFSLRFYERVNLQVGLLRSKWRRNDDVVRGEERLQEIL